MCNLSSGWTWFYKFAFPGIWLGGFTIGTLAMFIQSVGEEHSDLREVRWAFLGITLLGALVMYPLMRLKRVRIESGALLISNFREEIQVPLQNVESISGTVMINPELIWFRLGQPTVFGSIIIFMPPVRFFHGFKKHPLAEEFRTLVKAASRNVAA